MRSIKFSHDYDKLPSFTDPVTLLEVFTVPVVSLSPPFVEYDTSYGNGEHYALPRSGSVLVLLLYQSCNNHLFTTVRRCTPSKEVYYRSHIDEEFALNISEAD